MEREIDDCDETTHINIRNFSSNICEKLNISSEALEDYIFAMISMGMVRNTLVYDQLNRLYNENKLKYYNIVMESSAAKHVLMKQSTLAEEVNGRKILAIVLAAEKDMELRSKLIKIMRKNYTIVYNSAKKLNNDELKNRYLKMDQVTRSIEGKFDAAIYFYFAIYCFPTSVDQMHILAIIKDVVEFNSANPITVDFDKELNRYKDKINDIKSALRKKYGKIFSSMDAVCSDNKLVAEAAERFENLMISNKLDPKYIFRKIQFIDIDKIILSFIKSGHNVEDYADIMKNLVAGIYMQSLTNEYLNCRKMYFNDCQETIHFKLLDTMNRNDILTDENMRLNEKISFLETENKRINDELSEKDNKIIKAYKNEVAKLEARIKELEQAIENERQYRIELNELREYAFQKNDEYIPKKSQIDIQMYLQKFSIIIIGGPKEWRRKIREKYPYLKTLNGFNENFELRILNNADYIFFYTGFMSHATYNRAINFVRNRQVNFGYIGKTNIELAEQEIAEQLVETYGENF
ncbi:hypothetical protein [Clostridium oryzae]|uniref:DUF2325 domain-containing protein n=1 Tax=Clostridium oryzae TaxID=1450648 RepID=A0A1V4IR03_9CLOT|nr:hypothetical protein [Clostridium oryzae]OPJ61907.1 hypothetical protein CLORY_19990 [Clostridium oryzae]